VGCSVLQCVAVRCSMLQCVAVHRSVCLICTSGQSGHCHGAYIRITVVVCCSVLQCVAVFTVRCRMSCIHASGLSMGWLRSVGSINNSRLVSV